MNDRIIDSRQCPKPAYGVVVTYQCGHQFTIRSRDAVEGACHAAKLCPDCLPEPTVHQADIFGGSHDTHATESQLNGWTTGSEPAPIARERTVCICGHGQQFHERHHGWCERCSNRRAGHTYQRVTTEPLFTMPGALL